MKAIFLSFFVGAFLLFAGPIYAENSAEEKAIITQCTQTWQHYNSALSRGDIEEALKYISDNSQEEFRFALQSDRRNVVHLGKITTLENIRNNIAQFKMLVEYEFTAVDDIPPGYSVGDTIQSEGYVNFVRDSSGNWKIDFY